MPSSNNDSNEHRTSEQGLRAAFDRLKVNAPIRLPSGTAVTQNNVAREAGLDPSALKKKRLPTLVSEIQHWKEFHQEDMPPSARQQKLKIRKKNRTARETIADLKRQRDEAVGLLADANLLIVELMEELQPKDKAPPSNVIYLDAK